MFSKLIILFYSIKMDMKSANNILFRHILSLIKVYSKLQNHDKKNHVIKHVRRTTNIKEINYFMKLRGRFSGC